MRQVNPKLKIGVMLYWAWWGEGADRSHHLESAQVVSFDDEAVCVVHENAIKFLSHGALYLEYEFNRNGSLGTYDLSEPTLLSEDSSCATEKP